LSGKWDEVRVLPSRRQKVVAVVAGVVLAGAGLLAFNFWLDGLIARQAEEQVELVGKRKVALAENRIGRVIATLEDLSRRGIDSCRPAQLEVLRQTALSIGLLKEISVIAADGQTLCTTLGTSAGPRKVLSSQRVAAPANVVIEVVSLADTKENMVRVRRLGSGNAAGLGVMLLGSRIISVSSMEENPVDGYARMTMPDGTLIGETGAAASAEAAGGDRLTSSLSSERYEFKVVGSVSRSSLNTNAIGLRTLGIMISGVLATLILGFSFVGPRRQRENPIAELERALKAGEFVPYYQPVVDLVSGKLRGAEVLIRWRKPDGTIISPAVFIPLAESSGIILDMTRALMRRVCQEIGPALAKRPHLKISFNLAARHFQDETILRDVREIFGRGTVRLSQLVLELTERQPIENLTETRRLIAALQGLGVRMAIDDVGTGHSGLSYILKLGVDIIKIDKMFIDAIGIERSSTTIIETLIDLAHNMRMDIVAEGVENFEQVVYLRDRGIRAAQGFVFAPPLPGSSFLQLVEAIDPADVEAETATPVTKAAAARAAAA
jgi:sensor c-di-GMP phosphodiesterase-like protein